MAHKKDLSTVQKTHPEIKVQLFGIEISCSTVLSRASTCAGSIVCQNLYTLSKSTHIYLDDKARNSINDQSHMA